MNIMSDGTYPKPVPPNPSDCCGTGCFPCVYDIYEKELEKWKLKKNDNSRDIDCILSKVEFKMLTVENIEKCSPDSYIYTLSCKEGAFKFNIGQHVIAKVNTDGKIIIRQYTPIEWTKTEFKLLLKIYSNGKATQIINSYICGDNFFIKGPYGLFDKNITKYDNIIMLCAGTGIAPMYPIICEVLNNEENYTQMKLYFAVKTEDDILLRTRLKLCEDYWNFSANYYISKVNRKTNLSNKYYCRLSKDTISSALKSLSGTVLVLICGTKSFEKDMINAALNADVSEDNIYKF